MPAQELLLVGPRALADRTIVSAERLQHPNFDDTGFLELTFWDLTQAVIVSTYECFTGLSQGEYPTNISIVGCSFSDYISHQETAAKIVGCTSLTGEEMASILNRLYSLSTNIDNDLHAQNIWNELIADYELLLSIQSFEQVTGTERSCQLIDLLYRLLSPAQVDSLALDLRKDESPFNLKFPGFRVPRYKWREE